MPSGIPLRLALITGELLPESPSASGAELSGLNVVNQGQQVACYTVRAIMSLHHKQEHSALSTDNLLLLRRPAGGGDRM